MSVRRPYAIVLAAGLACVAAAQPVNTQLRYEVSHDGLIWASTIAAMPGNTIQVRTVVSYIGTGTVLGLSQIIFQPVVSGWGPDDVLLTTPGTPGNQGVGPVGGVGTPTPGHVPDEPGVWGRISPFGTVATTTTNFLRGHIGTGTAAGMLRIARSNITNWIGVGPSSGTGAVNNTHGGGGVIAAQWGLPVNRPPYPAFNSQTQNINVFKFGFVVGAAFGVREMTISTPPLGIGRSTASSSYGAGNVLWHQFENEVVGSLRGGAEIVNASVFVVPTPGGAALLAFAALGLRRRRPQGLLPPH